MRTPESSQSGNATPIPKRWKKSRKVLSKYYTKKVSECNSPNPFEKASYFKSKRQLDLDLDQNVGDLSKKQSKRN